MKTLPKIATTQAPAAAEAAQDTRPAYYCQNPRCAGTPTFPSFCHGMPMVTR